MFPYKTITGYNEPNGVQNYIYTSTGVLTLPPGTDTLVDENGIQTLTNKTLGSGCSFTSNISVSGAPNIGSSTNSQWIGQLFTSYVVANYLQGLTSGSIISLVNLIPNTDNSVSLGQLGNRWSSLYAVNVNGLNVPTSGSNLVSDTATQTLTSKTLTAPVISQIVSGSATLNVPTSGSNLVSDTATQTLTSKTLTAPTISNPTFSSPSNQAALCAYMSSASSNATGDGTTVLIVCDTVQEQTGSNYSTSTGIFSAPANGFYNVAYTIYLSGITSSVSEILSGIYFSAGITTGHIAMQRCSYQAVSSTSGIYICQFSRILYLTNTTTIQPFVQCSGSTKNITINVGSSNAYNTSFCVYQLV